MTTSTLFFIVLLFGVFAFSKPIHDNEVDIEGWVTAFWNSTSSSWYLIEGKNPAGAASGKWKSRDSTNGWNELWVVQPSSFHSVWTEQQIAEAIGFVEGALSYQVIQDYWYNLNTLADSEIFPSPTNKQEVMSFLATQQQWTQSMISKNPSSALWIQADLIQRQLTGIMEGYNSVADSNSQRSLMDFVFLNSFPDILDLVNAVNESTREDWFNLSKEEAILKFHKRTHCSALIKPSPKLDLFSGHTTWVFFSMMNRVFKHIESPFKNVVGKRASFSSYPGLVASSDDFYVLSSGLVVIETTNSIFNNSLYSAVVPQSLLSWQRTVLANRLASNGEQWSLTFATYNSGTYNNQWMVVDYNQWSAGSKKNVLWISEQIPGMIKSGDQTSLFLSQNYWPSYNVPFYPEIFNLSGYAQMVQQYGDAFSYQKCPRANIFRRNETNVNTLENLKSILRYNDYKNDPLSLGDPGCAIASRFDLENENPNPMGGIDTKVTSSELVKSVAADAIAGPTADQQPAFSWLEHGFNQKYPFRGQPEVWDFDWHIMRFP